MSKVNLLQHRLNNQQIAHHAFSTPEEVVAWMGAIQGQDYLGAKWSVGLRLPNATDDNIENAVANKSVIRTWALRGTLHLVAAPDVQWMLSLISSRIIAGHASYYRKFEIDKTIITKSQSTITRLLRDGKQLTRKEIAAGLEQKGIATHALRMNFILHRAAMDKLICHGARHGKEFTYTLFDEWVPATKSIGREEALAKLALRYYTSHGPATLQDFIWWSGLSVTEAKLSLEIVKSKLLQETIEDKVYWMADNMSPLKTKLQAIYLLPGFDEYMISYKDRGAIVTDKEFKQIASGNGLFSSMLIINGRIAGTWKRTFKKDKVMIEIKPFAALNKAQNIVLTHAIKQYGNFLEMDAVL